MFRRDTKAEADFRVEVRAWLEANLPMALRGRTVRPPPAELMPAWRGCACGLVRTSAYIQSE